MRPGYLTTLADRAPLGHDQLVGKLIGKLIVKLIEKLV